MLIQRFVCAYFMFFRLLETLDVNVTFAIRLYLLGNNLSISILPLFSAMPLHLVTMPIYVDLLFSILSHSGTYEGKMKEG